jgi:serine/threonine-protein kinase RsbW
MTTPIQFRDLGSVMDDLHEAFEEWANAGTLCPPLDPFSMEVLKFAIHEWVANLVQHADFGARTPLIQLAIQPNGERVCCAIEDNSRGFDFELQLDHQRDAVATATPPERGRGLLMLIACTEDLRYRQPSGPASADARHRLEFSISASNRPWIDIPF